MGEWGPDPPPPPVKTSRQWHFAGWPMVARLEYLYEPPFPSVKI